MTGQAGRLSWCDKRNLKVAPLYLLMLVMLISDDAQYVQITVQMDYDFSCWQLFLLGLFVTRAMTACGCRVGVGQSVTINKWSKTMIARSQIHNCSPRL